MYFYAIKTCTTSQRLKKAAMVETLIYTCCENNAGHTQYTW